MQFLETAVHWPLEAFELVQFVSSIDVLFFYAILFSWLRSIIPFFYGRSIIHTFTSCMVCLCILLSGLHLDLGSGGMGPNQVQVTGFK